MFEPAFLLRSHLKHRECRDSADELYDLAPDSQQPDPSLDVSAVLPDS